MSTAATKARKRAGEKHRKIGVPKTGTPLGDRHIPLVWKKGPDGKLGWHQSNRALSRREERVAVSAWKGWQRRQKAGA